MTKEMTKQRLDLNEIKAKEIAIYIMSYCGCNNTQGIPFKEMVREIKFLIESS